jgi:PhzF family phenazine biosynthesis protein
VRIRLYQLDAFTDRLFHGNPAAVCPLDEWPEDETLQAIADENNLSETAFFVEEGHGYRLRWFTPRTEVDLCGHATLASAWVIFHRLEPDTAAVRFETRSGTLTVVRRDEDLIMDFPARPPEPKEAPRALIEGVGAEPAEVHASRRDYVLLYGSEEDVRKLRPDFARLRGLDRLGVIATAAGNGSDFVSRFFAPSVGVHEDPVTGSAHCTLAPFWSERLEVGEHWMTALQVSKRGGQLAVRSRGDRVDIGGTAVLYLEGTIEI